MRIITVFALITCIVIVLSSSTFQASESPLSKLMREMAGDMKKLRASTIEGKVYTKWGKSYDKINTAKPSADSKKGEHFEEYSTVFLNQVERTKQAKTATEIKPAYNLLVQSCIRCHETYCPGPITMLKKLAIP
jgi:hypothetical protein